MSDSPALQDLEINNAFSHVLNIRPIANLNELSTVMLHTRIFEEDTVTAITNRLGQYSRTDQLNIGVKFVLEDAAGAQSVGSAYRESIVEEAGGDVNRAVQKVIASEFVDMLQSRL
jgi:hypothetical protein